jgi:hypothetical protein
MFHVPNQFRVRTGKMGSEDTAGNNGYFVMQERLTGAAKNHAGKARFLLVIASDGQAWEHVSVHCETEDHKLYTPRWDEMQGIKSLFWSPEDVVVQFHPADNRYKNQHPNTLHLWRLYGGWEDFLPMPPVELV